MRPIGRSEYIAEEGWRLTVQIKARTRRSVASALEDVLELVRSDKLSGADSDDAKSFIFKLWRSR